MIMVDTVHFVIYGAIDGSALYSCDWLSLY